METDEIKRICATLQLPNKHNISNQYSMSSFYSRLAQEQSRSTKVYNDLELQDFARECIPIEKLHDQAHLSNSDFQESLLRALLVWFKGDFFKWVDKLACDECSSPDYRWNWIRKS